MLWIPLWIPPIIVLFMWFSWNHVIEMPLLYRWKIGRSILSDWFFFFLFKYHIYVGLKVSTVCWSAGALQFQSHSHYNYSPLFHKRKSICSKQYRWKIASCWGCFLKLGIFICVIALSICCNFSIYIRLEVCKERGKGGLVILSNFYLETIYGADYLGSEVWHK